MVEFAKKLDESEAYLLEDVYVEELDGKYAPIPIIISPF